MHGNLANGCPGGVPTWVLPLSIATSGAGLMIKGISDYSAVNSEWEIETNQSTDNILFEDLNKRYKNAQYLMYGGGLIIGYGVFRWVKEIMAKKRRTSLTGGGISIQSEYVLKFEPVSHHPQTMGIGLVLEF